MKLIIIIAIVIFIALVVWVVRCVLKVGRDFDDRMDDLCGRHNYPKK